MKRYEFIIKREVSYIEEVHAVIVAENEVDALDIAEDIGEGGRAVTSPPVVRYNIFDREEIAFDLISTELVRHDEAA